MDDISITVTENVTAAFDAAIALGEDMTPVMGEIARFMVKETKLNFRNQSSPLGVPWKKSQRVLDEGGMTLVKSSDLFGSIKEDWGKDHAAAGPEASGGAAIYAKIHQFGGTISRKTAPLPKGKAMGPLRPGSVTMPARPYLGWNDRMETGVLGILADQVQRVFNGGAIGTASAGA